MGKSSKNLCNFIILFTNENLKKELIKLPLTDFGKTISFERAFWVGNGWQKWLIYFAKIGYANW